MPLDDKKLRPSEFIEIMNEDSMFNLSTMPELLSSDEEVFSQTFSEEETPYIPSTVTSISRQKEKVSKKVKSKIWNEMEKDLFLKGMELFGKNCRKISKFIGSKTFKQVKLYYDQWSATANVIPDTVNLANDSSIYLPTPADGIITNSDSVSVSKDSFLERNLGGMSSMGEGMVVSSLNDWNLGSQVSIVEENPTNAIQDKIASTKVSKVEKPSRIIAKKRGIAKKIPKRQAEKKAKTENVSPKKGKLKKLKNGTVSKPVHEGQIIHLSKDEDEESDVNIDDENESDIEYEKVVSDKHYNTGERNDLTNDEHNFYNKLLKLGYDISISEYKLITNTIICEWKRVSPNSVNPGDFTTQDSKLVTEICKYLQENNQINITKIDESLDQSINKSIKPMKRVLADRKKNILVDSVLNGKQLSSNVIQKGGGVTLVHDSSGAVVNALHIPDSRSSTANKSQETEKNMKILDCRKYKDGSMAPFSSVIYTQAIITLETHSHSSLSEVIGLLGGFLDEINRVLHITLAVPTKSLSSSGFECEMCPVSQAEAFQVIQSKGMDVIGWYHSHPTFLPNPSQRDVDTQNQLQMWFKKKESPFIGLIVSPFIPNARLNSSQISCFLLDSPPNSPSSKSRSNNSLGIPYVIDWKVWEEFHSDYEDIETSIDDILQIRKDNVDCIDFSSPWKDGLTYLDKLLSSLSHLLTDNIKEIIQLIKIKLSRD